MSKQSKYKQAQPLEIQQPFNHWKVNNFFEASKTPKIEANALRGPRGRLLSKGVGGMQNNNQEMDNQTSATNLFMNSFSQKAGYNQGNMSRTRIRL